MVTRLLIQKFSGVSRSASFLGAHASAARAAAAMEGVFHGAAVHPGVMAPGNPVIHGYAARCFNVFPYSHADAKTSLTTTGMPSTITNCMKPSFLNFTEGVKRTFSSSASKSNNHKFTMEAEMAARQAQDAAHKPLSAIEQVRKDVDTTIALMAFTCLVSSIRLPMIAQVQQWFKSLLKLLQLPVPGFKSKGSTGLGSAKYYKAAACVCVCVFDKIPLRF